MRKDMIEKDIKIVLDYMWKEEEKHYQESAGSKKHIFCVLKRLSDILDYKPS